MEEVEEDLGDDPAELVGRTIRVYWKDDDAWYAAAIRKFNSWSGQHLLRYIEDGVEEWVDLNKEQVQLVRKNIWNIRRIRRIR